MAENEAQGMDFAGALTQEALDALLAAADAEGAEMAGGGGGDVWAQETVGDAPGPDISPMAGMFPAAGAVDLPSFDSPSARTFGGGETGGMTRVRDIPLEVTVELGRTRLLIRDILDLGTGSIIELDKLAGEPVDLFANGLMVARGEVIVIDDNFGVRVTEIITAAERGQKKEAAALAA